MKITITSRERIERLARKPFPARTAVISITDSDALPAELRCKPDFLLPLAFDDMEPDSDLLAELLKDDPDFRNECRIITDTQAGEIAIFAQVIYPLADLLICQCECGQSRSAAVAAAIMEHFSRNGREIFSDSRYSPNRYVFRLVMEKLRGKNEYAQK